MHWKPVQPHRQLHESTTWERLGQGRSWAIDIYISTWTSLVQYLHLAPEDMRFPDILNATSGMGGPSLPMLTFQLQYTLEMVVKFWSPKKEVYHLSSTAFLQSRHKVIKLYPVKLAWQDLSKYFFLLLCKLTSIIYCIQFITTTHLVRHHFWMSFAILYFFLCHNTKLPSPFLERHLHLRLAFLSSGLIVIVHQFHPFADISSNKYLLDQ